MEQIILTEQEVALLSAAYPDPERIRDHQLFDYQVEGLMQLRAGAAYLEEKYPRHSLEITSFSPASQFTKWAQLEFRDGAGETVYHLTVEPQGDGFDCADDYYGALLREPYDRRIAETLAAGGYTAASYTHFPALKGAEVGEETTVDQLMEMGSGLTRNTHLFAVLSGEPQAMADGIRDRLMDAGFYGSFTLYFAPGVDKPAEELEAGRQAWEYVSFSCFRS